MPHRIQNITLKPSRNKQQQTGSSAQPRPTHHPPRARETQQKYPSPSKRMSPSTLAWRCLLPHTAGPLARSSHAMAVVGTTVRVEIVGARTVGSSVDLVRLGCLWLDNICARPHPHKIYIINTPIYIYIYPYISPGLPLRRGKRPARARRRAPAHAQPHVCGRGGRGREVGAAGGWVIGFWGWGGVRGVSSLVGRIEGLWIVSVHGTH